MIKKNKIPTLLGIVILIAGIFTGVYFLGVRQIFRIGADASTAPKDVRVSNQTDTSVTISWVTDKETSGFVSWGSSKNSLNRVEKETEDTQRFFTHSITVTGLEPNTQYFYKINSDGHMVDNNGLPWEFTTGTALDVNGTSILISGSVLSSSGSPAKRSIVYANVGGYLMSTLASGTGNYVFQLGLVRTQDLQSYLTINPAQTLVEISVVNEAGVASAQVFPQSGSPIPPIILGQVYDFRGLEPSAQNQNPSLNLSLPQGVQKESKFSLPVFTGTPTPTSVILESITEGEVITSSKPSFFGRGPAGQSVTITVESDPITETFNIASNGTWTWTPPTSLPSGTHKLTVSWIDATGITRVITRTFIVQAGEVPAFEATPSQTLVPTVAPTVVPTPTATPVTVASASPSAIPTPTAPPIPETGGLTPTIILTIMGIAMMTFSFLIWKHSES